MWHVRSRMWNIDFMACAWHGKRKGSRNGWCFSTDLNALVPHSATTAAIPSAAPSIPSACADRVCGACDSVFGGHLKNYARLKISNLWYTSRGQ